MKTSTLITNAVYCFLIIMIVSYFLFMATGRPTTVIVRGGSMKPTLEDGDVIFIVPRDPNKIRIGDIIVFRIPGAFLVHRVVDIKYVDGKPKFITKGDANPCTDQEVGLPPVPPEKVVGVLYSINDYPLRAPYIGKIYTYGQEFIIFWTCGKPFALFPCILLAMALIGTYTTGRRPSVGYPFTYTPLTKDLIVFLIILTIILTQFSSLTLLNFRLHTFTMVMGVETTPTVKADINFGSLTLGAVSYTHLTLPTTERV